MGNKKLQFKLPTNYTEEEIKRVVAKKLNTTDFTFSVANKSLDARNKRNILWNIQLVVSSQSIKHEEFTAPEPLQIPKKKRNKKVVVVGSGPAGFFSAYVLQQAGFDTVILERGHDVITRDAGIRKFETTGEFSASDNYAFGEGGAGTFSDGKLTSRSKHISKEKAFIINTYVEAGAPKEIAYLAHPHVGSDNLKKMMVNMRKMYEGIGGEIQFGTQVTGIRARQKTVEGVITNKGDYQTDYVIFATGHSAYETYRMLMKQGVVFRTKNFAIGARAEHPQEIINKAQWGSKTLPGVKAAEYRLTHNAENKLPVYTFCMCPGGIVVPATPYKHTNIVNGMSLYKRNNSFANAACVAGVNLNKILNKEVEATEALDWLESLEQRFFDASTSYTAPFCSIKDFLNKRITTQKIESSYPLGVSPFPLWEQFPEEITVALQNGLSNFSRKLRGYENGNLIGLESKTSAPIQVLRNDAGFCEGWTNLLLAGEGSGYSGGIISSAADGIKKAFAILGV